MRQHGEHGRALDILHDMRGYFFDRNFSLMIISKKILKHFRNHGVGKRFKKVPTMHDAKYLFSVLIQSNKYQKNMYRKSMYQHRDFDS
jgi:hypothetical protein